LQNPLSRQAIGGVTKITFAAGATAASLPQKQPVLRESRTPTGPAVRPASALATVSHYFRALRPPSENGFNNVRFSELYTKFLIHLMEISPITTPECEISRHAVQVTLTRLVAFRQQLRDF